MVKCAVWLTVRYQDNREIFSSETTSCCIIHPFLYLLPQSFCVCVRVLGGLPMFGHDSWHVIHSQVFVRGRHAYQTNLDVRDVRWNIRMWTRSSVCGRGQTGRVNHPLRCYLRESDRRLWRSGECSSACLRNPSHTRRASAACLTTEQGHCQVGGYYFLSSRHVRIMKGDVNDWGQQCRDTICRNCIRRLKYGRTHKKIGNWPNEQSKHLLSPIICYEGKWTIFIMNFLVNMLSHGSIFTSDRAVLFLVWLVCRITEKLVRSHWNSGDVHRQGRGKGPLNFELNPHDLQIIFFVSIYIIRCFLAYW